MVVLGTYAGFSAALGAFIMGSVLAETTKAEKIEHLTRPVKNLFGAIFFVSVGMLLDPKMLILHSVPIIAATLVLLFGKPFFVTIGAVAAGQPLRTAVQSGMSLTQIGELSFIIATLGLTLKVTGDFLYPVAVVVSVLTAFTTPYMIRFSEPVYKRLVKILPAKWKNTLTNYSIQAQNITEISDWKKVIRFYFINVVIFSVIIIAIIFLSTTYLAPLFAGYSWNNTITAIVTLFILAPFLWALAFRRTQRQAYANVWMNSSLRSPLVVLLLSRIFLAVFYIGFLFDRLFSPWVALIGSIISCFILFIFSKRIRAFYGRIEKRFLANLNERENTTSAKHEILTPLDTHITTFDLSAYSQYVGKTLFESGIREEFGVNIVVIERGDYVINIPGRNERLFPGDKLSVIGTDEQLEKFRIYLDSGSSAVQATSKKQTISLHHFTLGRNSSLVNSSIRESRLRERSKGLVVAVEREGERVLNPGSDFIFHTYDKVWIVGNEMRIQVLTKELAL